MNDRSLFVRLAPVVALAALAAAGFGGEYAALVGALAVVFAIVALGFVVLTGWAGDVSLGQVVPYGLGAYATFFLTDRAGVPVLLAIPLAALLVVPVMAAVGVPALRLRGLDLAIATFALALVGQLLLFNNLGKWLTPRVADLTQFSSSVVRVGRPELLRTNRAFYVAALLALAALWLGVTAVGRSRLGRLLHAVRDDPVRAAAMGIPVGALRLVAFVIAGFLAAFAGGMTASLRQAVTPETFTVFESLNLLALAVIGGLTTTGGALVGGAVGALLPELARYDPFRFLQGRLNGIYGLALVVVLTARPGGLASLFTRTTRSPADPPRPSRGESPDERTRAPRRAALLQIDGLTVAFGGVRAVDRVSLRIADGEEVALIGPNGAGKSSLFAAVGGQLRPAEGRIYVGGDDVTDWPVHRRAAAGVARTFQAGRPLPAFTVADQLALAAEPYSAGDLVERLGLGPFAGDFPSQLPYGARRALEVGLALARRPRLLLLDEPTAGMTPDDARSLVALLAELHDERDVTLLLVEHDMAVVGQLARRVVVLDRGVVIADADAAAVARDPAVIDAYLGSTAASVGRKARAGAAR